MTCPQCGKPVAYKGKGRPATWHPACRAEALSAGRTTRLTALRRTYGPAKVLPRKWKCLNCGTPHTTPAVQGRQPMYCDRKCARAYAVKCAAPQHVPTRS